MLMSDLIFYCFVIIKKKIIATLHNYELYLLQKYKFLHSYVNTCRAWNLQTAQALWEGTVTIFTSHECVNMVDNILLQLISRQ